MVFRLFDGSLIFDERRWTSKDSLPVVADQFSELVVDVCELSLLINDVHRVSEGLSKCLILL